MHASRPARRTQPPDLHENLIKPVATTMTCPILKKKAGGGREQDRVEGAGVNQVSTCFGRKRSATTTICLHPL